MSSNKPYSISHHKRLNPKKDAVFGKKKHILKKKVKASSGDLSYLSWLQDLARPCIVCGNYSVEWHHVKRDSTDKKDHERLIPLCRDHHTESKELSAHGTPILFRETYSMDYQYSYADRLYKIYLKEMI